MGYKAQGTLDLGDINFDGALDVYDLGVVVTNLIYKMSKQANPVADNGKKR